MESPSSLHVALGATLLGVLIAALARYLRKRAPTAPPAPSPSDAAKDAVADVHTAAAIEVEKNLEAKVGEVATAAADPKPGSALAALWNRSKSRRRK